MSYPPNYGYPQPGGQYPPPAAGGGGIGFEGLAASTPSYPAGPGYPQGGHAPYPNVSTAIPGAHPYQQPPAANPYCPPASAAPMYGGGGGYAPPQAPAFSFGAAARATTAFRQPIGQNYAMPQSYAQPTHPYQQPPQSSQPPTNYSQPAYRPPPTAPQVAPAYHQPVSAPPPSSAPPLSARPPPTAPHHQPAPAQQPHPAQPAQKFPAHVRAEAPSELHRHNTLPLKHMTFQGTIKPHSPFNAQHDAEVLKKAMKGWGCDEKAITHIMTTRSNKQRQQILLEYKTIYGKDLIKDLRDELSGHYQDVVLALMVAPDDYDATILRKAMKGLGTDEDALIEILCTRTNTEIRAINTSFKNLFDRDLEKDIRSETSGNFRKLLVSQVQGQRDDVEHVDVPKAIQDAQDLYNAGEGRWGTDESRFNVILASRSYPQLRTTFEEYKKICKYSVEHSIEREMSGDLKKGMITIVKCVKNTPSYFAEQLYKSMKGLGTKDDVLIRICVSRAEIDMVQIKKTFADMYGQTLGRFISDDTSGNYKKILLDIIGDGR